jgi:hypothetical protein
MIVKHKNMIAEIVKKSSMSLFQIMLAISNRCTYEISYDIAWRAKQKALEWRFGYFGVPSGPLGA